MMKIEHDLSILYQKIAFNVHSCHLKYLTENKKSYIKINVANIVDIVKITTFQLMK